MIGNSNDETNFSHKLLLTNIQVSKIDRAYPNGSSANIEFSKTNLSKSVQLGGFLFGSPDIFDLPMTPIKGIISLANSIAKESKNTGIKRLSNDILVDAGLNAGL